MTNCKGCPFLPNQLIREKLIRFECCGGFVVDNNYYPKEEPSSKDCQLELVQYTLKDKRDSITFIPEEE